MECVRRSGGQPLLYRPFSEVLVTHTTTVKVRFGDLDPYDHVNHARYFTYFESARVEMLEQIGFGMDVMKSAGYQIVLVEVTAAFHAPAVLHDRLVIETSVVEVKRATTRWHQEARREGELVSSLKRGNQRRPASVTRRRKSWVSGRWGDRNSSPGGPSSHTRPS